MAGNQDAAKARADAAVKKAQAAREAFDIGHGRQYQVGDGALIAQADRNLAKARAERDRLG